MIYTVFGIYPDNNQRHTDTVEASDPTLAQYHYRKECGCDMLIAAVVEGDVDTVDSETYAHQ